MIRSTSIMKLLGSGRRTLQFGVLAAVLCLPLRRAGAQYLDAHAGIGGERGGIEGATQPPSGAARAKPYVIGGAAIGAGAMVAGLVIYYRTSNAETVMSPFALIPAVALSAGVGALGGYLVYRVRH